MKVIYCRDLGRDCNAKMRGKTKEDVINATINHSVSMHGMDQKELSSEDKLVEITAAVKNEENT